jgi:hypothetical protein
MKRLLLFVIALGLALTACATPPPRLTATPDASTAPRLAQPFVLALGQSATLSDAPIKISFDGISEDSRCPKQVTCVWIERVVLDLTAQVGQGAPMTLTLATLHSPKQTNRAALDAYEIVLQSVQPYPETPDNPIRLEDYRAEFVVQRP